VQQAHDAGLEVWYWTLVAEQELMPPVLAGATLGDQVAAACEVGADALVTDQADQVRRSLES
jgi:glycerophosphoryl diester phosphodiesterase